MPGAGFLNLRLFLEGIEVPVIAATISSTPNSATAAAIQVIPTDAALFMKERTTVHLFFYDYIDTAAQEDDRYKLLFSGDLVGFNFQKDPQSRNLVLQCLDHTNIWDTTYQYYMNFGGDNTNLDGVFTKVGAVTETVFNDQLHPVLTIRDIIVDGAELTSLPRSFPGLQGLLGGLIHLTEELGGVVANNKVEGRGVNPFYVGYNLRNRVTDQIFAASEDTTSTQLFDISALTDLIARDLGQGGFRLSLKEILEILLGYVYFSHVHITTPKYEASAGFAVNKLARDRAGKDAKNIKERIRQLTAVLDAAKARAPKRDIPDELYDNFAEDLLDPSKPELFLPSLKERTNTIISLQDVIAGQERRLQRLEAVEQAAPLQEDRLRSFIFRPDIYFMPPPRCNVLFPDLYDQFSFSRNMLAEPTRLFLDTTHVIIDQGDPLRRAMKLRALAPMDIPSMDGTVLSDDPANIKVSGTLRRPLIGIDAEDEKVKIMPHERFTGILPAWTTIPDLAVYPSRRNAENPNSNQPRGAFNVDIPYIRDAANFEFFKAKFASREMGISGKFNPYLAMGFPCLVVDKPTAIRSEDRSFAEFVEEAVKGEKNTTTSTLEFPKNGDKDRKRKVVGLDPDSGDRPVKSDPRKKFQTGVHFLGMIGGLQHSINQDGGTTQTQLVNVHAHNEAVQFTEEGDLAKISLEDFLFPGWFDDIYKPENISGFYQRAFGSRSIMAEGIGGTDSNRGRPVLPTLNADGVSKSVATATAVATQPKKLKESEIKSLDDVDKKRKQLAAFRFDFNIPLFQKSGKRGGKSVRQSRPTAKKLSDFTDPKTVSYDALKEDISSIQSKLSTMQKSVIRINIEIKNGNIIFPGTNEEKSASGANFSAYSRDVGRAIDVAKDIKKAEDALDEAKGATDKASQDAAKAAEKQGVRPRIYRNDVRRSVESLVQQYASVLDSVGETTNWVHSYIFRDIANLDEVLGSFFSRAFGDAEIPELSQVVKSVTAAGTDFTALDALDPREPRRLIVLQYLAETGAAVTSTTSFGSSSPAAASRTLAGGSALG